MTATMDWNNLSFKATDVVKLLVGLITVIWVASGINNRLTNVSDNQELMRNTQVEFIKDYKINQKAIELKVNAMEIEQKLQGMRIEALEKQSVK